MILAILHHLTREFKDHLKSSNMHVAASMHHQITLVVHVEGFYM